MAWVMVGIAHHDTKKLSSFNGANLPPTEAAGLDKLRRNEASVQFISLLSVWLEPVRGMMS